MQIGPRPDSRRERESKIFPMLSSRFGALSISALMIYIDIARRRERKWNIETIQAQRASSVSAGTRDACLASNALQVALVESCSKKSRAHTPYPAMVKSKKHFLSTHSHDEKRAACRMHLSRKCMQMLLKMQQLTLQSRRRARLFFSFSLVANRTPLNTNIYPEERDAGRFSALCAPRDRAFLTSAGKVIYAIRRCTDDCTL